MTSTSSATFRRRTAGRWLGLLFLLLAAFALRLANLEGQSIWWDEGISLNLARSSLPVILADRLHNIHPPLYFILLKGWAALAGLSAFSGRYLSVLAGWLQVAAVYAVCRRWFGRRTGTAVVALMLIALSPLSVIYSQEIRVYALLPLVYLALLAFAWQTVDRPPAGGRRRWILFGLLAWTGLHLHYVVAFVLAFVCFWLLLALVHGRRGPALRRFLVTMAGVGLASLPWFAAVVRNWAAVQAEANAGTYLTDPAPLDFLLRQVWVFHHTGLAGSVGRPVVWGLAVAAGGLMAGLLLWRLWQKSPRKTAVRLLLQWIAPLTGALVVWSVRSFSHPRYILFTAVGTIILAAYLIAPALPGRSKEPWPEKLLKGILPASLFIVLLLIYGTGLRLYFLDPSVAKDDMRGAARFLAQTLTGPDLIIVPDAGWAFAFEYTGDSTIVMPGLGEREVVWQNLEAWTASPRRVATVNPATGARDWQGMIPFALEQSGSLLAMHEFDGLDVHIYQVERPFARPSFTATDAFFGPFQLAGSWVEGMGDDAITIALQWQKVAPGDERLEVHLTLLAEDGWPLGSIRNVIVDENGRPTEQWQVGHTAVTTHILPVPLGTPPLTYQVGLGVTVEDGAGGARPLEAQNSLGQYQGQQVTLAQTVTVSAAERGADNPYRLSPGLPRLPAAVEMAPGLTLLAAGLDRGQASGGQPLVVSLEWQATGPLLDLRPEVRLVQNGQVLAAAADHPALGRYPTGGWGAGELVLEHRVLLLPALVESGTAVVEVALDGQTVTIGQMDIVASEHRFEAPQPMHPVDVNFGGVARLVGFDMPTLEIQAAEPLPLTLYWQSLADGQVTAYTVFTHLLAAEDGRLIGQHDSAPVNGTRPTTGWVKDEFITDSHAIQLRQTDYQGQAIISVGLYDPATGERLLIDEATDAFVLPLVITVKPPVE